MHIGADALPFSRALVFSIAPIFRSEIRQAPRQQGQKRHRARRRSRNQTVFRFVCPEYFAPDQKGGADVQPAALCMACADSKKSREEKPRRTCPIQFWTEGRPRREASKR